MPKSGRSCSDGRRVGAEALAIVPLRGVDATDGSTRFAGLSGLGGRGGACFRRYRTAARHLAVLAGVSQLPSPDVERARHNQSSEIGAVGRR